MIARYDLVRIHIEKQNAGLTDRQYREILMTTAGVNSSKLLPNSSKVAEVVEAIKNAGAKREGWSRTQLQTWRKYAKLCNMDERNANTLVYKITGLMSAEAPGLDQTDFDMSMAEIERILENNIKLGISTLPDGMDINYWRARNPRNGLANRRELRFILLLWDELCEIIGQEKHNANYLYAFIAKACRLKTEVTLDKLRSHHAHVVIEALKMRLDQEHERIKKQRKEDNDLTATA